MSDNKIINYSLTTTNGNTTVGVVGDKNFDKSNKNCIFEKLKALDGNNNDLSITDIDLSKNLIGTNGVTNVRRDSKVGIVTVIFDDNTTVRFDFETDFEKKAQDTTNQPPQKPVLPERDEERKGTVKYTVWNGDALSLIAQKYSSTQKLITERNPEIFKNGRILQPGDELIIPVFSKEQNLAYEKAMAQYWQDYDKYEKYQAEQQRLEKVKQGKIAEEKAEKYYPGKYNFDFCKDENGIENGRVLITTNIEMTLGELREELGIPKGDLTYYNPSLKEEPLLEIGSTGVYTRDLQEVPYDGVVLPGNHIHPVETTWYTIKERFKDLWNKLFN